MELMTEEFIQTELGSIPDDWKLCRFEDVMDGFSSGQTPYREIKRYYTGNIPWITSGELNYNVITDTIEKITPEAVQKTTLKIIPKGTFLMAITGLEAAGTRGSCAITGVNATTNQSCMALYPKPGLLITEYLLHFYVRYGDFLAFKYCQGTKQQSYTGAIAKTLPIILPPTIEEQTAIATALSDADALNTALEKLIAKKRAIKQGVMQKLLQPKEGWEVKTYGEIFDFLNTATYSRSELVDDGEIRYVHYGDIHMKWKYFLDVESSKLPSIRESQLKNYSIVKEGDLIMADASEDYAGIGKSVEVKNVEQTKLISGLHTFLLRDEKKILVDGFRGYMHENTYIKRQFYRLATGMKVYGVSKNNLMTVQVPVPSKAEQLRIVSILNDMDSEILVLEKKLSKQRQLKQGMMQNLLTGKIRLV
ncbi:MAG: restriction endonuclease subunit S [Cyclobacteriaceae bacterium]